MKSLNLFFILVCFSFHFSMAQGLIFDAEEFSKGVQLEKSRTDKVSISVSLKSYTPYVLKQQNSTCVAYSLAVARTILLAMNYSITSKDEITANCISPHWIYFRNKSNDDSSCELGLSIEKTVKDLINNGAPRMAFVEYPEYYPFSSTVLCNYYPPKFDEDIAEAKNWMLDDVFRITDLDGVKIALSLRMPIVVGMLIPKSFSDLKNKMLWEPLENDRPEDGFAHAMIIVGYDDNKYGGSVEILNSWGEEWANDGYIWIKYEDFLKYTVGAYALNDQKKFGAEIQNNAIDKLLDLDLKLSMESNIDTTASTRFKSIDEQFRLISTRIN